MKPGSHPRGRSTSARLDSVTKAILREVRPSQLEIKATTRTANEMMGRLKGAVPRSVEILLAGSIARGTQMAGNADIDIFLLFPKGTSKSDLEKKGLAAARSIIDSKKHEHCVVKYAEHPYARLHLEDRGVTVDVVPAFKIAKADERASAVDRTQLHNQFVMSHMTLAQRDSVRVLKAFLDRHGVYGAEAMIEGFSGYLCELLVHHYGSFQKVVAAFATAKLPLVIDSDKHAEIAGNASAVLVKKFNSKFIVIDPTDSNRNVAANVSLESLARAALASRVLLKNPSKSTFDKQGYSDISSARRISALARELGASVYTVHFRAPDIAEDIIWQQLKRLSSRLSKELTSGGFAPLMSLVRLQARDAVLSLIVRDESKKADIVMGPSAFMANAASSFINARKHSLAISLDGDRLYAIGEPRFGTPKALLREFLTGKKAELPSYLKKKDMHVYVNRMPERIAKLVYQAYVDTRIDYKV